MTTKQYAHRPAGLFDVYDSCSLSTFGSIIGYRYLVVYPISEEEMMNCLCGKKMQLLINEPPDPANWTYRGQVLKPMKVWACPPEGCGRIYLEGSGAEIKGTFYLPEQNERRLEL